MMQALRGSADLFAAIAHDLASRWRAFRRDRFALSLGVLLAVLTFAFFFWRLEVTIAAHVPQNAVFGADTQLFQNSIDARTYGLASKYAKHPFPAIPFVAVTKSAQAVGQDGGMAAALYLALIAAIAALLCNCFLLIHGATAPGAFLATLLSFSLFSAVSIFSVLELYSFIVMAIFAGAILLSEFAAQAAARPRDAAILAGIVGAVLASANLTAMAFLLIFSAIAWPSMRGWRQRLIYLFVVPMGIAFAFALAMNLVLQGIGYGWILYQSGRWGALHNFADLAVLRNYAVDFFVFSSVSPTAKIVCGYSVAQLGAFLASPWRVALWSGLAVQAVYGAVLGLRNDRTRPVILGLLAVVGCYFLFHIYFDPREVLLFACQFVPLFVVIAAIGIRPGAAQYVWLIVLLALSLAINVPPLSAENLVGLVNCGA